MNRELVGNWGVELSPQEFACALAASGICRGWSVHMDQESVAHHLRWIVGREAHRALTWHISPRDVRGHAHHSAKPWADGWRQFVRESGSPRLELERLSQQFWCEAVGLFASEAVSALSVYVREDQPEGEVRWNWPLRAGFLGDPASQSLRRALLESIEREKTGWRHQYIEICSPEEMRGLGCHVLLLPAALKESLANLCSATEIVRAACVLVLGSAEAHPGSGVLLAAIRAQARAEGVGLIDIPERLLRQRYECCFAATEKDVHRFRAAWFIELVRELSHNQTLDVALFSLWRRFGSSRLPPVLAASRRMIEDTPVGQRLARLAEQFQGPLLTDLSFDIGPETAGRFAVEPGKTTFKSLGRKICDRADAFRYDRESDMGTAMLNLLDVARRARRKAEPRPPRWVQARVFEASGERYPDRPDDAPGRPLTRSFQPGAAHVVEVFIGPRESEAIQPPKNAPPLPEEGLPDDRGVRLTVVFAESAPERTPQVATVFLPRDGRSTACRFFVTVAEASERVEARILVLFRNRILQTSILRGPVDSNSHMEGPGIKIEPEVMVHDRLDGLEHRNDFDATILLNHSDDGLPAITTVRNERGERFPLPAEVERAIEWFDDKMEEIAENADDFRSGLAGKANVTLLRQIAQQGSMLWKAFDELMPAGFDWSRLERLQVVSADPNTRLPIEFFYDGEAPLPDAELCPQATEALKTGCGKDACPFKQDDSVICPLGFWGLTKILERHMHQKGEPTNPNELRVADPVDGRDHLSLLGQSLFAASQQVDEVQRGGIAEVNEALRLIWQAPQEPILDWASWSRHIQEQAANLLLIMPHVVEDDQPAMEIGMASRLLAANISAAHVRTPTDREPPPVVILLGCQTGKAAFPFASLVAPFRRLGAAIVLCTGAPIVGRHAVPVAQALLKAIQAATSSGVPRSLGDVVREVRRAMVLDGLPMVFTVLAFGDSDWRIGLAPDAAIAPTTLSMTEEAALVTP